MLPASNKSGEGGADGTGRDTNGDETGHKWACASLLTACPIFYGFSQIVDHRRLRFRYVTDVRDSSPGLPVRRQEPNVPSELPSQQGTGRGAMPRQGQFSTGSGSQGAEFPEYGQPDDEALARRQPGPGSHPRQPGSPPARTPARLVAPGGRHRRAMPASLPESAPALVLAVPDAGADGLAGVTA